MYQIEVSDVYTCGKDYIVQTIIQVSVWSV